ncbi:MAG TPA: TolC family protein, partial [Gemmatales bacterium]|nr:TolC family protein [Gemmatales bacterium]
MAFDNRLETLEQTIALQKESLRIARAKKEAGRDTELAVQRFQAEVSKNESETLIVKQEIVEVENRLNFLLGRFPQHIDRPSAKFLDLQMRALGTGVPSQLLRNRPDIRQAEHELAAAGLEVEVARAEFYPSLDITGGLGFQAFNPKYLFNPDALIGGAAGEMVTPLINKTAIQAAYKTANAKQLQSIYNYQRVILEAFTEVMNRVSMAENYQKSIEVKKQQLASLELSVATANKLFQNARAEYIEVLFAQRDLLEARMGLIETKRKQLSAIINSYQALGGGLPSTEPPAGIPVETK